MITDADTPMDANMVPIPYTFKMPRCPRCGGAHEMEMKPFKRGHPKFAHWGICVNTGEPLMIGEHPNRKASDTGWGAK